MLRRPAKTQTHPSNSNCAVNAISPPDLDKIPQVQKERYEEVVKAIQHAWTGYKSTVLTPYKSSFQRFTGILPADDLEPLTLTGQTWLHSAATLFDSLDTLYIAGLHDEYNEALDLALSLPLPLHPTKTFEYSIRVLGGLLGCYSVTGEKRVLDYAQFVTDSILDGAFRSSPTPLPRMFDVLAPVGHFSSIRLIDWGALFIHRIYAASYRYGRDKENVHINNSLAGFGTFALEFAFLSRLTGDNTYKKASDDIFRFLQDNGAKPPARSRHRKPTIEQSQSQSQSDTSQTVGMLPSMWDVLKGIPVQRNFGLGGGSDSYYEYLIKSAVLLQPLKDEVDLDMVKSYSRVFAQSFLAEKSPGLRVDEDSNGEIIYPVNHGVQYQHLLCFVPGMIALGETYYNSQLDYVEDGSVESDYALSLAMNMTNGCWKTYSQSPTGLGPETLDITGKSKVRRLPRIRSTLANQGYYLRPEFVESLFILYRTTKDEKYREIAWQVFQSIEKYCKHEVGYTSLNNVNDINGESRKNHMPSFFIAETLKYILLIFAPDDYIGLDEFVFNTEAHPLRQIHTIGSLSDESCERLSPVIHQPMVPVFVLVSNCLFFLSGWLFLFLRSRRCCKKKRKHKKTL